MTLCYTKASPNLRHACSKLFAMHDASCMESWGNMSCNMHGCFHLMWPISKLIRGHLASMHLHISMHDLCLDIEMDTYVSLAFPNTQLKAWRVTPATHVGPIQWQTHPLTKHMHDMHNYGLPLGSAIISPQMSATSKTNSCRNEHSVKKTMPCMIKIMILGQKQKNTKNHRFHNYEKKVSVSELWMKKRSIKYKVYQLTLGTFFFVPKEGSGMVDFISFVNVQ